MAENKSNHVGTWYLKALAVIFLLLAMSLPLLNDLFVSETVTPFRRVVIVFLSLACLTTAVGLYRIALLRAEQRELDEVKRTHASLFKEIDDEFTHFLEGDK